jgi:photosystem II stability/assembly factor-like uncharacterized protein
MAATPGKPFSSGHCEPQKWVSATRIAIAPTRPETIYAITMRIANGSTSVYKSTDAGATWHATGGRSLVLPNRDGWGTALAVDPQRPTTHSWKTVFPPHPTRHPRENVSALAIAPSRPKAIYTITGEFANPSATPASGRTSMYKSTDAGTTWQATTVVRGSVHPTALAVDPRHPTTVYAAIAARVLKTTNAGKTWQPIARGLPISHTRGTCHCLSLGSVRALTVDPRRSGTVYAALTQGGIFKTTNGGQTWTRTLDTPLFLISTAAVDPARPTSIYASGQGETGDGPRILRSTDGGYTWAWAPRATP